MIDFDEEVSKFRPSLEIDQTEDAILNSVTTDLSDILDRIFDKDGRVRHSEEER